MQPLVMSAPGFANALAALQHDEPRSSASKRRSDCKTRWSSTNDDGIRPECHEVPPLLAVHYSGRYIRRSGNRRRIMFTASSHSQLSSFHRAAACALVLCATGCFLPISYTEGASPPLAGEYRRADGKPVAG